jgi:hypothetical protein
MVSPKILKHLVHRPAKTFSTMEHLIASFDLKDKIQMVNQTMDSLIQDSVKAFHAIDLNRTTLWLSVGTVVLSPLFWNVIARNEYKRKTLTKIFGTKERACSFFSFCVFTLGLVSYLINSTERFSVVAFLFDIFDYAKAA